MSRVEVSAVAADEAGAAGDRGRVAWSWGLQLAEVGGEGVVGLAGDVALEAADDLAFGRRQTAIMCSVRLALQLTGAPPSEDGAGPAAPASAGRPPATTSPSSAASRGAGRLLPLHRPSLRSLRSAGVDAGVVTGRNLRHFIRQPQLLIFSTIQPIMFVLLFVYVFGGAVKGSLPGGVTYIDFLLPGIFVQSVAFRATQTAVGLSEDLERGVIDRFRSMPMARSAVLIGRTVADLVRNVLIIGLMTVVGYLIGFRFQAGLPNAVACVVVVSAFGLALSWIFAFVALTVRGAEAAQRSHGRSRCSRSRRRGCSRRSATRSR
jgi:hypothetical protein